LKTQTDESSETITQEKRSEAHTTASTFPPPPPPPVTKLIPADVFDGKEKEAIPPACGDWSVVVGWSNENKVVLVGPFRHHITRRHTHTETDTTIMTTEPTRIRGDGWMDRCCWRRSDVARTTGSIRTATGSYPPNTHHYRAPSPQHAPVQGPIPTTRMVVFPTT